MTAGRGPDAVNEARALIGRRVRFAGHDGTIVDITASQNGYVRYVVQWDPGTPASWGTVVAPGGLAWLEDPT